MIFLFLTYFTQYDGLAQDGGVGHVLIPSYEKTGIITNCWTTIDQKMLTPTKKDTLHSNTNEKPQQNGRRGTIMIR